MSKKIILYEDAAEQIALSVWRCKVCGKAWPAGIHDAERYARSCCSTDSPCSGNCGNRVMGRRGLSLRLCCVCQGTQDLHRWQKLLAEKGVDWDGETPLCEWRGDRFFFSQEDIQQYLDDNAPMEIEDVRLVLCERSKVRVFQMGDYQSDHWSDEETDFSEIDQVVNDWLKSNQPNTWTPTGTPIRPGSLGLDVEGTG